MATDGTKQTTAIDHLEYHGSGQESDLEKKADPYVGHREPDEDGVVTLKTWAVVVVLAMSYGISFWPVPFFSTIQSGMAAGFGAEAAEGAWLTSVYSMVRSVGDCRIRPH